MVQGQVRFLRLPPEGLRDSGWLSKASPKMVQRPPKASPGRLRGPGSPPEGSARTTQKGFEAPGSPLKACPPQRDARMQGRLVRLHREEPKHPGLPLFFPFGGTVV